MPRFIVIDFLNHEGEIKGPGTEVELPVQVAAHPNVRGHITPAPGDESAEVALLPERDGALGRNVLRAGAPLREHELIGQRELVIAEQRLYQTRLAGVEADLKAIDDELTRLRTPAAPAGGPVAPAAAAPSVGTAVSAAPATAQVLTGADGVVREVDSQ